MNLTVGLLFSLSVGCVGCATLEQKALDEHCQTAVADMRCAPPPKPKSREGLMKVCNQRGAVLREEDCHYENRGDFMRVLGGERWQH